MCSIVYVFSKGERLSKKEGCYKRNVKDIQVKEKISLYLEKERGINEGMIHEEVEARC